MLLKKFVEWTQPKSNALAAASNFRRLEQGDLSLAEYIDKATILYDQCQYPPEACDRLLRDVIVIGLRSKEAYYKCIEKGSPLMLEEAIEIAQNQDATAHQVGYMRPEFKGDPLQMEVHKLQGNRQTGDEITLPMCACISSSSIVDFTVWLRGWSLESASAMMHLLSRNMLDLLEVESHQSYSKSLISWWKLIQCVSTQKWHQGFMVCFHRD